MHVVGARISSERAKERLKRLKVIATKEVIRLGEGSFPTLDSAIENVSIQNAIGTPQVRYFVGKR